MIRRWTCACALLFVLAGCKESTVAIKLHFGADALDASVASSIRGLQVRLSGAASGDHLYDVTNTNWVGGYITIKARASSMSSTIAITADGLDTPTGSGIKVASGMVEVSTTLASTEATIELQPLPTDGMDGGADLAGQVTLTVNFEGAGAGQFTARIAGNSGTPCMGAKSSDGGASGTCVFPKSSQLQVTATNDDSDRLVHFVGCDSTTSTTCTLNALDQDKAITIVFDGNNYMFVTQAPLPAIFNTPSNTDPLTAADDFCAAQAQVGGSVVPVGKTYKAWLSTSAIDAKNRLANYRGWIRPDGRPFAFEIADATGDIVIFYPPRLDQTGADTSPANESVTVATGTYSTGLRDTANNCANWQSTSACYTSGWAGSGTVNWTYPGSSFNCTSNNCATHSRIYCFETTLNADAAHFPTPSLPPNARVAFVTSATYPLPFGAGAGLTDADEKCNGEKPTLPGTTRTYQALIAQGTGFAMNRFTVGTSWHRLDGVKVLEDTNDAGRGLARVVAPLNLDQRGELVSGDGRGDVWTGAIDPWDSSANKRTCKSTDDWKTTSGQSYVGRSYSSDAFFFNDQQNGFWDACSAQNRLYCVQVNP